MHLENAWNYFNGLTIHSLEDLFILYWQFIKTALKFSALTHQTALGCPHKRVILLLQLILRPKNNDIAGDAQILDLEIRIDAVDCLIRCFFCLV